MAEPVGDVNAAPAPNSQDAEESILGAMLLSGKAIEAVLAVLEPNGERCFYRRSHGLVYRACRSLYRAGKPVDGITVAALLETKGRLAEAGGDKDGRTRIHELAALVPAAGNAAHYARIVRDLWLKRIGTEITWRAHEAYANGVPSREARETLMSDLLRLEALEHRGGESEPLSDLIGRVEARVADPPQDLGLPTPFPGFPTLKPQRVYVLSGYTGDGKTAVACQFAACAASKRNARVGFATVEMSGEQLADRMIAGFGVPLAQIESGRIGPAYQPAYDEACAALAPLRVDVLDDPGMNAARLEPIQRARRYDLLVVDHLHQINLGAKPAEHRHRLEQEVQAFVTLARRENVPILLLAQLSRQGAGQPYPRPTLSMLRETARIEQQAALVAFVWRKRDDRNQPTDDAELIIAKDRFGPTGASLLHFDGPTMRYTEVDAWR